MRCVFAKKEVSTRPSLTSSGRHWISSGGREAIISSLAAAELGGPGRSVVSSVRGGLVGVWAGVGSAVGCVSWGFGNGLSVVCADLGGAAVVAGVVIVVGSAVVAGTFVVGGWL